MGKTVYEYTGLADVNSNITTAAFPFAPQDLRDWGIGLPKRTTVYDSSGVLQKSDTYTYRLDTAFFVNDNFKSTKIGNSAAVYSGIPSLSTLTSRVFVGQEYYPSTGHAYLTSVVDTLFNPDGSKSTSYNNYVYDTNFNVTKVVKSYIRQNSTQLEHRIYYPYNYYLSSGAVKQLKDSGIISPIIATEDWITGDATPRIVAGSITDLQVLSTKQVVPATVYSLESRAPVPQATIGLFDSSKINRNTGYFRSEQSLVKYDANANLLQTKNNVTGISNTVLMDYYNLYPVAKISNAAWADVAYTSFESDGSGNWTIGSTTRDKTGGLTGKQGYNLSNGNVTRTGLTTTTTYIVSVWAKTGASVSINGTAQSSAIPTQNGWNLYFTTVTGVSTITVSGSGVIDELREYPKDANMMTYTYEPTIGVTSAADANSTVTYTEYDGLNRIKVLRDKDRNILKRYDHTDSDSLISLLPRDSAYIGWQSPATSCMMDSAYVDVNPFSDSFHVTKITYTGTNYCTCSYSANYPQYKIVNGACELGTKVYSSSVYEKITNPNGPTPPQVWGWACTWHYVWSDCSVSSDQIEYNTTGACTVSSGCGPM